jgi:2-polyprenyl-3-methyl-5-hydroxy-6-metoxy-1,4-benzoquinol methylase
MGSSTGYEPSSAEVALTLALSRTVMRPYYACYVRGLGLRGNERVLDYGSGSGGLAAHLADVLAARGGRLTCIDVSETWCDVTQRALQHYDRVDCHSGEFAALDIEDGAYDLVLSHFVLHDVPPPERPAIVRHLAQKLRPGGRFVLREPAGDDHGISVADIRRVMEPAGLEEVAMVARTILLAQHVSDGEFRKPLD